MAKSKYIKWLWAAAIVALLVLVRALGKNIFYDPFIDFFHHGDYKSMPLPELESGKLIFSMISRFVLNSALSLALIFVIFQNKDYIKVTAGIMAFVFVILFPVFLYFSYNASAGEYLYLFYTRRILIHPVLVLILIPAFYFYQREQRAE